MKKGFAENCECSGGYYPYSNCDDGNDFVIPKMTAVEFHQLQGYFINIANKNNLEIIKKYKNNF
tara:strand:- start:5005 stop:5196 length:192 start_codon:yes stop_codon:yes gene_type:complete